MKRPQSISKESRCQSGCIVLIRLLLIHLVMVQGVLSWAPIGQLAAIGVYVTGLITGTEISATAISAAVGLVSHDALSRLLNSTWWTGRHLILTAVKLATLVGTEGWLILDDVVVPKLYARLIAFCCWDYDHALRRHVFGVRLVVIVWSNGWLTLPLGFSVWQKDPGRQQRKKTRGHRRGRPRKRGRKITSQTPQARQRRTRQRALRQGARQVRPRTATGTHYHTKNELARGLVWQVVRAGVRAQVLLFDNWYASRENLRVFSRLGLVWVTRLKSNTVVLSQGQRRTVKQVAQSVAKVNYHYYAKLRARVRSFEVKLGGRPVKLTVIKDDTHEESGRTKYLATSELSVSHCDHVQWYRRRWAIEVFFRDAKQMLGLGRSQARTAQAVLTHIVLVCVSYVALQLLKPLGSQPHLSVSQSKKALGALRLLQNPSDTASLVWLKTEGRFEPVEVEHLWTPVRTRLSGISLPEKPAILGVYMSSMGYA